jgi:membrane associated rhomboid family serine protease
MAYYRPRGFNSIPPVIKNLLIINVLMWFAQLTFREPFYIPLSLHHPDSPYFGVWQLVTYMFLHSPEMFFHILFNMFALWMFGSSLEQVWGSKRFFMFYVICGIGAGLIQLLTYKIDGMIMLNKLIDAGLPAWQVEMAKERLAVGYTLGASGAVMGVFAAFAYLFPNTPMIIFPFPIPIKAKYVMIGLMAIDLFSGINPRYSSGVAHFAHIGGALVGLILVMTMNRHNRRNFY